MESIEDKVLKVVEDTVVDLVTNINTSGCGTPELREKKNDDILHRWAPWRCGEEGKEKDLKND